MTAEIHRFTGAVHRRRRVRPAGTADLAAGLASDLREMAADAFVDKDLLRVLADRADGLARRLRGEELPEA